MRAFVLSTAVSVGFLVISVMAMRRHRLREQAAILWVLVSIAMVFVSVTLPLNILGHVSRFVGINYPPDFILLLGVLFLVMLVFHLSLSLDRLSAKQTALVQEIGLLTAPPPPLPTDDKSVAPDEATTTTH